MGDNTLVVGACDDQKVRLWHLDDLARPVPGRRVLPRQWSPSRLAEHEGRLLCLATAGAARYAFVDALTGELLAGPDRTTEGQDLSAAAMAVIERQLRYAIGTGFGSLGIGGMGAEAAWIRLPTDDWIADVVMCGDELYVVSAQGGVHVVDLTLRRHAERDFRAATDDDKIVRARLDGPGRLLLTHWSGAPAGGMSVPENLHWESLRHRRMLPATRPVRRPSATSGST